VGIFTRRQEQKDGSFSTSAWTIEEKATALAAGKRLLLFVENGVPDFGGLQGDYEYIPFDRDNLGEALIQAMDYVLAITSIPLTCRVEGPNKLHFKIGAKVSPNDCGMAETSLCHALDYVTANYRVVSLTTSS
jgi:hypothetical protein